MLRTIIALLLVLWSGVAHAEKRVALVIGNSAYHNVPKLPNPSNDAIDMAGALKKLGFQVIDGFDLEKGFMERKLQEFARSLTESDVGLLFYAGHGLQVDGQNYLVPIDAKLEHPSGLDFELVRLDIVQSAMERETRTNILFLDACRDNPLARNLARGSGARSIVIGRGLAQTEASGGTLISYSTQPGNFALDGSGRNSPFAGALLRHISAPGVDLGRILMEVRREVMQETENRQMPWEHSALLKLFFFRPSDAGAEVSAARLDEATKAWDRTKYTSNIAVLEAYATRYKDTFYAELAQAQIEQIKREKATVAGRWAQACGSNCWGAVAEKKGAVFGREREKTKALAMGGALELCEKRMGISGCQIAAVLSGKQCWALAEVPSKPEQSRSSTGESLEEAMSLALADCKRNYDYCRVSLTFCADGSNRISPIQGIR